MFNFNKFGLVCYILCVLLGAGASVAFFLKGDYLFGGIWAVFAVMNLISFILRVTTKKKVEEKPKEEDDLITLDEVKKIMNKEVDD